MSDGRLTEILMDIRAAITGWFRRRWAKVPIVQSLAATDCGPACLAMILGYYGRRVRLDEVRETSGAGRDGTDALAIIDTARAFGMRGRGVRIEVEDLEYLETPSILHWNFNHFVVFERFNGRSIDIVDPSAGRRRFGMAQVSRSFTGVALLLQPRDDFEVSPAVETRRTWRYMREILAGAGLFGRTLVLSVFLQLLALSLPILTGAIVDSVVPRHDYSLLKLLAFGLASVITFQFLSSLVRAQVLLHMRTYLDARMTTAFLEHLVDLPYSFFARRVTGDLIMRLNSNSTIREIITSGALSGVLDGVLVTAYLIIIFATSRTMGILVLCLASIQLLIFMFSRRQRRELNSENLQVQARLQGYQVDMLGGMETLKTMGSEVRAVENWSDLFVDVLNSTLARGKLNSLVESLLGTLRLASPLVILGLGALQVLEGRLTLGTMLGLNALAGGFLGPFSSLLSNATQFQLLSSYFERIDDVLACTPEQDIKTRRTAPALTGRITLENVSFRYAQSGPMVVREVSVDVKPGQFVAIVGRSGAGKSTLASLLSGLYTPDSGRVLYDGHDLNELELRSVRRQLGVVSQSAYLFGISLRANISLPDPYLTLEQIIEASKLACIHDDVAEMPMGYETLLMDRGATLSGGQRQRIALARALVTNPAILVLDEATSTLDAITELRVQQNLAALRCTRIIIAHRLSTVIAADRILLIDDGKILEDGKHDELLALGGAYARLVAAQREQPKAPARI